MPECSCPSPYADCPHPPLPGPISFTVGQERGVAHIVADCPECGYQSAKMPGPAAAALDVINHGLRMHVRNGEPNHEAIVMADRFRERRQ